MTKVLFNGIMRLAMNKGIGKYIGDRAFYKMALSVALPIILQGLVTSFVSLLDNIMVGQVGTAAMSGVAVGGQLMFNYMLLIFGIVSGPGIFCAQFFGARDADSLRAAFRYKLYAALMVALAGLVVLSVWGMDLAGLFLTGEEAAKAEVVANVEDYLRVMLWMILPFALTNVYSSSLRETGQTVVPMIASCAAVAVNLFLNWVLIFGKLGAPALEVKGAAIATVIARFVELAVVMVWSHRHAREVIFPHETFRKGFGLRPALAWDITRRSLPLFVNEFLWSTGTSVVMQIYSTRGLEVMAALNIAYVVLDLFQMAAFSTGNTIGILVGQELGAGRLEQAVDTDRKLIAFGLAIALGMAALMCVVAPVFPELYNTTAEVKTLAARFMMIMAALMPFTTLSHTCYFTLRSGGKTLITFVFDSCFMWAVNVPAAWCAAHLTVWPVLLVFAFASSMDIIKAAIGLYLVGKKTWVNNLAQQNGT